MLICVWSVYLCLTCVLNSSPRLVNRYSYPYAALQLSHTTWYELWLIQFPTSSRIPFRQVSCTNTIYIQYLDVCFLMWVCLNHQLFGVTIAFRAIKLVMIVMTPAAISASKVWYFIWTPFRKILKSAYFNTVFPKCYFWQGQQHGYCAELTFQQFISSPVSTPAVNTRHAPKTTQWILFTPKNSPE